VPDVRPHRSSTARRLPVLATAVLAALAVGVATAAAATGPDVSGWQHPRSAAIRWSSLSDERSFVFVKATEGAGYTNPWFRTDWAGSAAAGLYHGAYHFARPSGRRGSAVAQARHFASVIGRQNRHDDLPPVLDLEVTGGLSPHRLVAWTATWLRAAAALTKRTPMIYTYPYFWVHDMGNTTRFRFSNRLWVASYSSRPQLFGGWRSWTFWQYSDRSTTRGIKGRIDMNRFAGTPAALDRLGCGSCTSRPVVVPVPGPLPTPSPTPTPTPTPTDPILPPDPVFPPDPVVSPDPVESVSPTVTPTTTATESDSSGAAAPGS
jgi:GH25 family lysozyme M1 (1,4-beta-N-acetylmuramidase)